MNSIGYMLDTKKFYNLIKTEKVIFSHYGALDAEMIDMIVQLSDKKLAKSRTPLKIKKKVINILIECLQNSYNYINNYLDNSRHDLLTSSPFLIIALNGDGILIYTGNYVTSEVANSLKKRIKELEKMDADKLQNYYIEVLNKEELPTSGGAGLGLVDILRRSKNNVTFELSKMNEDYMLFSLLIKIV